MTAYVAKKDSSRCPTHPGAILREDVLPALGLTKVEIASRLGISRQHLNDLLAEKKPITPAMAVRIGKFLGNGPALWVNMQAAHDTWHAERDVDTSMIETVRVKSLEPAE